jgi:hypothetical protein
MSVTRDMHAATTPAMSGMVRASGSGAWSSRTGPPRVTGVSTGRRVIALCAAAVFVTACGGGDDSDATSAAGDVGDAADDTDENVFDDVGDAADEFESGASSFEVLDAPTVTADPGGAVVEVDGQRFEYQLAGSISPTCEVSPEYVQVNIQSADGYSMSLVVSKATGSWTGSLTAVGEDTNIAYGSGFGGGRVGIGDNAVSYEGPIDKVVDRDIMNPETMNGTVAVNCDAPGGDPPRRSGIRRSSSPSAGRRASIARSGSTRSRSG